MFISLSFAEPQPEVCCKKNLPGSESLEITKKLLDESLRVVCGNIYTQSSINKIISELRVKYFPGLANISIELKTFDNDEYYLDTKFGNIVKNAKKRNYSIRVNRKFLEENPNFCPPDKKSLRAILAHELYHIKDYVERGTFGMIGLGSKYLSKKSRASYERSADERVLKLALRENDLDLIDGLKGYRNWIYKKLDQKAFANKKYFYFTPKEIDDWISNHK